MKYMQLLLLYQEGLLTKYKDIKDMQVFNLQQNDEIIIPYNLYKIRVRMFR